MFECSNCHRSFEKQQSLKAHRSHCLGHRPKMYKTKTRVNKDLAWNDIEVLKAAVASSRSKAEVIIKMGGTLGGGYYRIFNRLVATHSISTTHFTGSGWLKGGTHNHTTKTPLSEILVEGSSYSTSNLRKRLIQEGLLKNECASCHSGPEWLGAPLTLELDHINGQCWDHRLENLRILCPNCHSQTETFCNRKRRK